MNKINVGVLYGGKSGEHEVSLRSAASVVANLDQTKFEIVPIGIDKQGCWFVNQLNDVFSENQPALNVKGTNSKPYNLEVGKLGVDVMFPVLHGPLCEDGTLQGLLELANVPYVGCGVLASALCMDKDVAKRLILQAGLDTVDFFTICKSEYQQNVIQVMSNIEKRFSYPMFVKPARIGSSVGINKVNNPLELQQALEDAFNYDLKVVVEVGVDAQEIELAVLENNHYGAEPIVSIPGEIRVKSKHAFYSYEAKYQDPDGAELLLPADLSDDEMKQVQRFAQQCFSILECEGMARVDLFVERRSRKILFNELNTLPGFTSISMYPKMMQASGVAYSDLLTTLIELAMARFERKNNLQSSYPHAS